MSLFEDDEKTSSYTWLMWLAIVAFGAWVSWYAWNNYHKDVQDKVTLCPSNGPSDHYVVLIDNTSPFPFNQKAALSQRIKTLVFSKVPEGALVSVFLLGEDYKRHDAPIFEKCKPAQWKDDMKFTASKKLFEKDYNERFAKPLDAVIQQISLDQKAKTSPIFEMLQLVGIKGFERVNVQGERHLIIYSDMVANMPQFSMYNTKLPTYKEFSNTPYGRDATTQTLEGAVVTINVLAAEPAAASYTKRSEFWERYFVASKVTLDGFYPMEAL